MAIPAPIEQFVTSNGVVFMPVHHRLAYTAQEEAAVTHVPGREWAKTVVWFADGEPVQAVLPAHMSVDIERLRQLIGARAVRLAREDEIVPLYPGCEPGAMPPFGPMYKQRVLVEKELTNDVDIVFNAGTHTDAMRMKYADFANLVKPVVGEFGRTPGH